MEWIKTFLINIIVFLAVAPFISFFIMWFLFFILYKEKKKATGLAMDITTFFLIASVSAMFNVIFNNGMGFWLIVFFFLIAAGLVGNAQNRLKGRLDFVKLYKVIWRTGFLLLAALYVLFLIIGIIKNIFS